MQRRLPRRPRHRSRRLNHQLHLRLLERIRLCSHLARRLRLYKDSNLLSLRRLQRLNNLHSNNLRQFRRLRRRLTGLHRLRRRYYLVK